MAMAPKRYSATRMDALLQCRFRVPTAYVENVLLPVDPTADLFLRVRLRREVLVQHLRHHILHRTTEQNSDKGKLRSLNLPLSP